MGPESKVGLCSCLCACVCQYHSESSSIHIKSCEMLCNLSSVSQLPLVCPAYSQKEIKVCNVPRCARRSKYIAGLVAI